MTRTTQIASDDDVGVRPVQLRRPRCVSLASIGDETTVSPSEGNEVRRDGRLGFGASHSTDEAGELAPEDPVEGSEASAGRSDRGKHAEHIEVHSHVHGTRTDSHGDPSGMANLSAEEPYALMRARTGLREPWRATARATRPDARPCVAGVPAQRRARASAVTFFPNRFASTDTASERR